MGNISAFGFSPTSLTYELKTNQKECQIITLESSSETIVVYDKWAENKDAGWNVNSFKTESSSHGLSLTYPTELLLDQRKVEVCISGSKEGEYHGVLLLKEEQKGNSIMQMGVWLKVFIGQPKTQATTTTQNTASTNTGTENSGGVALDVQKQETEKKTITEVKETDKTTTSGITGAAVGTNNSGAGKIFLIIIVILVAFGGFIALFNYKRLQKRRMEYGY